MPMREEVKRVVWSCGTEKAPGYDGFNLRFILRMKDIVGPDILSFVKVFFHNGSFPTTINATWVTLIPNVNTP